MSNPGDRWRRWWLVGVASLFVLGAIVLARCAAEDPAGSPAPAQTTAVPVAAQTEAPTTFVDAPMTAADTTLADTTLADSTETETTLPAVSVETEKAEAVGEIARLVELEGVGFDSGSATLNDAGIATLEKVASSLLAVPELALTINGYTDSSGDPALNLALSQARSDAVKVFLVNKGIAADRLTPVGHGADNPVADNATPQGRTKNRRIEFVRS